jgi:hypothetical protein
MSNEHINCGIVATHQPFAPEEGEGARQRSSIHTPRYSKKNGRMYVSKTALLILAWSVLLPLCGMHSATASESSSTCIQGVCTPSVSPIVCSVRSRALGSALSLSTAGTQVRFTINARDARGSPALDSDAIFHAEILQPESEGGLPMPIQSLSLSQPCLSSQVGCISSVTVTNPGSGCTEGGMLAADGGFSASFTQASGSIQSVTIVSGGSGYSSPPPITILSGGTGCTGYAFVASISTGSEHLVHYKITTSGSYRMIVSLLESGGLQDVTSAVTTGQYSPQGAVYGISAGGGIYIPGNVDASRVKSRWRGLVRATETGLATFFIDSKGGVRLAVDDKVIINELNVTTMSTRTASSSAPVQLVAGRLYALSLDLTHPPVTSQTPISWATTAGGPRKIIPDSALFGRYVLPDFPSRVFIRPGPASAGTSVFRAALMSPATVGPLTLEVVARCVQCVSRFGQLIQAFHNQYWVVARHAILHPRLRFGFFS